ncbi:Hypp2736 [Branchiostoma lanceolatum]|uniref:Hypp2736 protein n=1 Tax=Branchiostoma lanceolatum TaxID=7740 RepID=A0A8J9ZU15_BRALA|nr:Hypp2736 [Branchiostoma lanceolatum]
MGSTLSNRNEVAPCENRGPLVPSIAIIPGTANSETSGRAAASHTEVSIVAAEDSPSTSQSFSVRKRKKTILSPTKENRPPMEDNEMTVARESATLPYGYQPGAPFIRLGAGAPSLNFVWSNTFSGDSRRKTVAGTSDGGAANSRRSSTVNKAEGERRHTTGEPTKKALPGKGFIGGKRLPTTEAQNRSSHQKPVLRRQRSSVISIGSTREGLEVKLVEREWEVDCSTTETAF